MGHCGNVHLVGTPAQIVDRFIQLNDAGWTGVRSISMIFFRISNFSASGSFRS